mgnify:CR=1 FL=1|tara:strand:+ start:48 stop:200 length:153 start_codon:yes stop_codon:yes gene_type:complete
MKKIAFILTTILLLTSCETTGVLKKPEFKKPFDKCPPKNERSLKDILCRE